MMYNYVCVIQSNKIRTYNLPQLAKYLSYGPIIRDFLFVCYNKDNLRFVRLFIHFLLQDIWAYEAKKERKGKENLGSVC